MKPLDRDRGLRLIGLVTALVVAFSLVAVVAFAQLAFNHTRYQDSHSSSPPR